MKELDIDKTTRISELTVGQLAELIRAEVAAAYEKKAQARVQYVYGIAGIAALFGCSETTAQRIKSSGVINKAIHQQGKTIVVDADLAVQLYGKGGRRSTI